MVENTNYDTEADGGIPAGSVQREQQTNYLQTEINLLRPSTPYMRDHLRIIWTSFAIWVLTTFGPITATAIAPSVMTTPMPILEFPVHYFAIAIVSPMSALVLAGWYAWKRDQLDEKYGIDHTTPSDRTQVTAADGGEHP